MGDYSAFCVNQSKLLPRVEINIIPYSLLAICYSLIANSYSLFTIHYLLFTIHYSLFNTPYTLHPTPYTLHPLLSPQTIDGLRFMDRKCKCAILKLSTGVGHPARSSLYLKVIKKVIESHRPLMDRLDAGPVTRVGNLFD
jgi:hypothetical protein